MSEQRPSQTLPADSAIQVYTDGACSGNPGPGGWAALILQPQKGWIEELAGYQSKTTNNQMELLAAIEGLRRASKLSTTSGKKILILTDSVYVIKGITQWIHGWKRNGWQTADGKPVSNVDLWQRLEAIVVTLKGFVAWQYVPGHAGVAGNERVDSLAVSYSKGEDPSVYCGPLSAYPYEIPLNAPQFLVPEGKKSPKGGKGQRPLYLVLKGRQLSHFLTWKECEAVVKGVSGARFKKVETKQDLEATLRSWGHDSNQVLAQVGENYFD